MPIMNHRDRETFKTWMIHIQKNYNVIPIFCDWLDDNGFRSQKWREICKLLPKVKAHITRVGLGIRLITPHRLISIRFFVLKNGRDFLCSPSISKRPHWMTNKYIKDNFISM